MQATDVIPFLCFSHAERVLSAMAKFLVHVLGEEEERGKMRGRDTGRSEERRGRIRMCRKWECAKIAPKTQQTWHLGTPLGVYRRVSYIFRKLFSNFHHI